MSQTLSPPSVTDVYAAAERIRGIAHRTPVVTCQAVDDWLGCRVYIKCENLQKTGAFKFRGAVNAVSQLSQSQLAAGVVTHSSGNHAAALSAAAARFGAAAHIVMPSNSAAIKKAAVASYGGQITECEPTLQARLEVAERVQSETGAVLVPPFDHPDVIAGQGTCALELLEQVSWLDAVVAPIGGGGLMSGTCLSVRGVRPEARIWGVEPSGADDALRSKQANRMIPQTAPDTICDGLRTSLGELTWPFIRDQVDQVITADDPATREAMRFVWERTKLIIEPSSAVVFAALHRYLPQLESADRPHHIGVIVSGGNVDLGW